MKLNDIPSAEKNSPSHASEKREKSRLRDRYLQEKEHIISEFGDLETMRMQIGLSQRKMCQLLLVDPTAWSRWLKTDGAPPHVYQALKWLLELKRHNPDAAVPSQTSHRIDVVQTSLQSKIQELENHVASLEQTLKAQLSLLIEVQRKESAQVKIHTNPKRNIKPKRKVKAKKKSKVQARRKIRKSKSAPKIKQKIRMGKRRKPNIKAKRKK